MNRIRKLNGYQRALLAAMGCMVVLFGALYARTVRQIGWEYRNAILLPSQEDGREVYTGKVSGEKIFFAVDHDGTVEFCREGGVSHRYTVTEDPAAIPGDEDPTQMTGVEIRRDDEILFRGGVRDTGYFWLLENEDGTGNIEIRYIGNDGLERDAEGNLIEKADPTAQEILELVNGPKHTHKGQWSVWFFGVVICIVNAAAMLFADELFYWNIMFRVRDPESAEPSEMEIAGRYIGWTAVAILALAVFVTGLQSSATL